MPARSLKTVSRALDQRPCKGILLIDDHAVFRHGLKSILQEHFDDAVFAEAENAEQALELCQKKSWDAAVLDITLPDRSGLEILQQLKAYQPGMRILVLSMHAEEHYAVRVLRAGAAGYISKSKAAREIADAVAQVIAGHIYFSPSLGKRVIDLLNGSETHPHQVLTDREMEIMRLIASGRSPKEIASELSVSIQTVSTHRASILRKMRFDNPVQLIRYAIEQRLVE
jgi:two-component system, NarL family, invasion response regulator UvrY